MLERSWDEIVASRGYTQAFIDSVRRKRAAAVAAKREVDKTLAPQAGTDILFLRLPSRMATIVMDTANRHGVSIPEIMSRSLKRRIVKARHEAWYLIKAGAPEQSFPAIARHFDRDHTVLIYAVAAHAHDNNLPSLNGYDVREQRAKNAHRARTRYLWDKAA